MVYIIHALINLLELLRQHAVRTNSAASLLQIRGPLSDAETTSVTALLQEPVAPTCFSQLLDNASPATRGAVQDLRTFAEDIATVTVALQRLSGDERLIVTPILNRLRQTLLTRDEALAAFVDSVRTPTDALVECVVSRPPYDAGAATIHDDTTAPPSEADTT